jgi:hypothetical protein
MPAQTPTTIAVAGIAAGQRIRRAEQFRCPRRYLCVVILNRRHVERARVRRARIASTAAHAPVSVVMHGTLCSMHATVLYLLGIDHTKLTYRYNGRDMRLTDVYGTPVARLLPEHFQYRRAAHCDPETWSGCEA